MSSSHTLKINDMNYESFYSWFKWKSGNKILLAGLGQKYVLDVENYGLLPWESHTYHFP